MESKLDAMLAALEEEYADSDLPPANGKSAANSGGGGGGGCVPNEKPAVNPDAAAPAEDKPKK
ncbi:hypothetical protein QQS21_012731 [Conoideocrella luteorostrata]|uniref:Uncharacterized protein n=1 Tax=Conoideocrella luteorostrata TaxID=1105319 RepID=A0AAJ0CBS1_9HYPO|nr:hypothetical protein QQS21_012731 [Conoideocrella luteorostrata]